MKRNRKGEVRIGRDEYRCGNYVIRTERYRMTVQDIGARVRWSIPITNPSGWLLGEAVRRRADEYITAYCTVIFTVLQTPPDGKFLQSVIDLCTEHIQSHPEYLGKEAPTEDKAADEAILREEQQLQQELDGQMQR